MLSTYRVLLLPQVDWQADRRVCGQNVTGYFVDIKTSAPFLNYFVGLFGRFPQDVCSPKGSKARDAIDLEDDAVSTCSPYENFCASRLRHASFKVPSVLVPLARLDVEVTVRAYGSHGPAGRPHEAVPCTWWCQKFRRLQPTQQPVRRWRSLRQLFGLQRRATRERRSGHHDQPE